MNLIEQLGGYEKAKVKAKELKYDLNNLEFLGGGSARESMYEKLDSIDHALLQYRRENNIFEVGDSVVLISGHSDEVHFLSDWYIENLDFRYTTKSGAWGVIVKSCMNGVWRHATDAEIKANKREVG